MSNYSGIHMYIYNMPYQTRRSLCGILDINNKWEELAGTYMQFDVGSIQRLKQAVLRNQSPTDELLTSWGTKNHTVLELFILLSKMQHYQAMMVLKDLVDQKYHSLIYQGEENLSRLFALQSLNDPDRNEAAAMENKAKIGEHNFNIHKIEVPHKVLFKAGACGGGDLDVEPKNLLMVGNPRNARRPSEDSIFGENSSPLIRYNELGLATDNWDKKNILGRGGFGTVYRGVWKKTPVAVKRLEVQRDRDVEETWRTHREQSLRELKYLTSCRHDNVLPLYGFSIGGPYDCLVYQLMPNGSLEARLLCRDPSKPPLPWFQRLSIATGTARGLQFLHTFGDTPLVHGDIKSANILLDSNMEPKIGDFGLAREGPLEQYTHVKVSRVHGTRPYLPDEFLRAKKFSTKVDTFSFGIVLFELATGLRAYDNSRLHKFLKDEVEAAFSDMQISKIQDTKAGPDETMIFLRLIDLGRMCVAQKPKDRPEMVQALVHLESTAPVETPPPNGRYVSRAAISSNSTLIPAFDLLAASTESHQSNSLPLISELGIKSQPSGSTNGSEGH